MSHLRPNYDYPAGAPMSINMLDDHSQEELHPVTTSSSQPSQSFPADSPFKDGFGGITSPPKQSIGHIDALTSSRSGHENIDMNPPLIDHDHFNVMSSSPASQDPGLGITESSTHFPDDGHYNATAVEMYPDTSVSPMHNFGNIGPAAASPLLHRGNSDASASPMLNYGFPDSGTSPLLQRGGSITSDSPMLNYGNMNATATPMLSRANSDATSYRLLNRDHVDPYGSPAMSHRNLDFQSSPMPKYDPYDVSSSPMYRNDSFDHTSPLSPMDADHSHRVLVDEKEEEDVPIASLLNSYLNKSGTAYRDADGFSTNNLHGRNAYRDEDSDISDSDNMDPYPWMTMADVKEPDDVIHDPDMKSPKSRFEPWRAVFNVGTIIFLILAVLMLFAGYPILHNYTMNHNTDKVKQSLSQVQSHDFSYPSGSFLSRFNNSKLSKNFDKNARMLIDPDTPEDAYELKSSYSRGRKNRRFKLVFSDEFNTDGRSFYPGEDPFWEAVDLHYWGTNNLEWYDPSAVTTKNGSLRIQLEQHPEHRLYFRGGMIQSWNKLCYRNGILIASIQLPGFKDVSGLWPAFWVMGNLGRAGFGASLQGTWPYSYDQCDVGTLMNQTIWNSTHPEGWPPHSTDLGGATMFNQKHNTSSISFLAGQKLSRCTCPGEDHPGPFNETLGEFTGRAAPEIDVFEAQIKDDKYVQMSQSCQMAPYNWQYNITWEHGKANTFHFFDDEDGSILNPYTGEITQQSLSGTHSASQTAVQYVANSTDTDVPGNFATYSMEYRGGSHNKQKEDAYEDSYVVWTSDGKPSWELFPDAVLADSLSHVGARQYPKEPMYIILNLGVSKNFGDIKWDKLMKAFPFEMAVDWVRLYQDPDDPDSHLGCDPEDMPTADYINRHMEAYTNANLTLWGNTREEGGYGADWPRNRLYSDGGACKRPPSKEPGDPDPKFKSKAPYVPSASVTKTPGAQFNWGDRTKTLPMATDAMVIPFP